VRRGREAGRGGMGGGARKDARENGTARWPSRPCRNIVFALTRVGKAVCSNASGVISTRSLSLRLEAAIKDYEPPRQGG